MRAAAAASVTVLLGDDYLGLGQRCSDQLKEKDAALADLLLPRPFLCSSVSASSVVENAQGMEK